jgi:Rps23 Pro-64 3,4-dihydroxylase Tpa1-like proline 4-hydroxylase
MQFNKIQSDLQTKGYTHFNLKEYDMDLYNLLLPFKCNATDNLQSHMVGLRVDGELKSKISDSELSLNFNNYYESYDIAKIEKLKALEQINNLQQTWYNQTFEIVSNSKNIDYTLINEVIFRLIRKCFQINDEVILSTIVNEITYYDEDCEIKNHQDGMYPERVCSILIYLNETYDEKDGGILELDGNESILPIFGNVAIISLSDSDVEHKVSKVVGGIGRYALCTFVKKSI